MFEFKIAFKYLLLKKRRLSSSLISLLSIFIISLVVWLVLVFLSVTNGIEKNWLNKLTSLNAPIRISPTEAYYSSYYYLIDSVSENSGYTSKNIKEKLLAKISDPYNPNSDMELPYIFPKPFYKDGKFIDPVKKIFKILNTNKKKYPDLAFQDYEISAALMRLTLHRENKDLFTHFKNEKISFLTQMTYLYSLTENNPNLISLLFPQSKEDLNHFLSKIDRYYDDVQKDLPERGKYLEKAIFQEKIKAREYGVSTFGVNRTGNGCTSSIFG